MSRRWNQPPTYPLQTAEHNADINIVNFYILCAGFGLVALGILYFFMGVLCLKNVRDRKAADYIIMKR